MSDDPPFLLIGTEISAKFNGAFCEARIKKANIGVKCKVQYTSDTPLPQTLHTIVSHKEINGDLVLGSSVKLNNGIVGKLVKLTDCSSYTVEFNDGDIRFLKRTGINIKGEKHFETSHTLNKLPLTNPESFSSPVVDKRHGGGGSKRKKVLRGDTRKLGGRDSVAMETMTADSTPDSQEEEETYEEKDHFLARVYTYMDDRGTPLNKLPCIGGVDVNLYKLFKVVSDMGSFNKVANNEKWSKVNEKMKIASKSSLPSSIVSKRLQMIYKKYLLDFEEFHRKLGVSSAELTQSLSSHNPSSISSNRSLIRKKRFAYSKDKKAKSIGGSAGLQKNEEKSATASTSTPLPQQRKRRDEEKEKRVKMLSKQHAREVAAKRRKKADVVADAGNQEKGKDDEKKKEESIFTPCTSFSTPSSPCHDEWWPSLGDKIQVRCPTSKRDSLQIYDAKITKVKKSRLNNVNQELYFVHYTGWNTRHDEWVKRENVLGLALGNNKSKQTPSSSQNSSVETLKNCFCSNKLRSTFGPVTRSSSPYLNAKMKQQNPPLEKELLPETKITRSASASSLLFYSDHEEAKMLPSSSASSPVQPTPLPDKCEDAEEKEIALDTELATPSLDVKKEEDDVLIETKDLDLLSSAIELKEKDENTEEIEADDPVCSPVIPVPYENLGLSPSHPFTANGREGFDESLLFKPSPAYSDISEVNLVEGTGGSLTSSPNPYFEHSKGSRRVKQHQTRKKFKVSGATPGRVTENATADSSSSSLFSSEIHRKKMILPDLPQNYSHKYVFEVVDGKNGELSLADQILQNEENLKRIKRLFQKYKCYILEIEKHMRSLLKVEMELSNNGSSGGNSFTCPNEKNSEEMKLLFEQIDHTLISKSPVYNTSSENSD